MKRAPAKPAKNDPGANGIAALLASLKLDASPELEGTPARVARLFREELTAGYAVDVNALLAKSTIRSRVRAAVVLHDVPIATTCPHHLMPAWGSLSVGFQPNGTLLGIGTVTEVARAFSRRLVLQEEITESLVDAIVKAIKPTWAACRIRLVHGCMVLASPTAEQIQVETVASYGRVPVGALAGDSRHKGHDS